MVTGWLFMALASVGHGDHVSMLDGSFAAWRGKDLPVSTTVPPAAAGRLTPKPAPDVVVTAPWVRERLQSSGVKLLDVRSERERANGYLPGSMLILWRDLFENPDQAIFKSRDEIRALLIKAGVGPTDQVVTYCAIGMRTSLMYFAAKYAGLPARVYVGSFDDWQRQGYPIVKMTCPAEGRLASQGDVTPWRSWRPSQSRAPAPPAQPASPRVSRIRHRLPARGHADWRRR
jgi:thiosulfate/3-mercaptopyruvate sulfurtransferase